MTLTELIEQARDLTPAERVRFADALMDGVEEPDSAVDPEIAAAWQQELSRRIDDMESGKVQLVDGQETVRIARAIVAERRAQSNG